jgi:MFS family permease
VVLPSALATREGYGFPTPYDLAIAPSKPSAALLDRPVVLLAGLAIAISLTFQILLPVVPVMVERAGPHGIAGAATAALFLGAVTGELSSPWLMTRWRSRPLLVGGQLVTGLSSLVYLLPHATTSEMIGAAAVRGIGMGVAIVIATALVAELAHPERRGTSIGYFGLALSLPGVFVPSVGVFILAAGHPEIDAILAFVFAMLGALAALRLPESRAHTVEGASNLLVAIRRPGLGAVFGAFILVSCSFGGGLTFVPVALPLDGLGSAATYLFVSGATRALSRWLAGLLADVVPPRRVLVGGVLISLCGLVALALHTNAAVVIFAGLAYGTGYGAIQTAAYVAMLERGTARDSGAISAFWNSGIDLGSSLGGTLIGLSAAQFGYAAAAWVLPGAVLLSLPLFLWRTPAAPTRTVEPPPETVALKS